MLYLINCTFSPTSASSIRVLAYAKALSMLGVKAKVVYFQPDVFFSKYDGILPNIEFEYLWEKYYINIPLLRKISLRLYLIRFVKELKSGDNVYIYSFPDLLVELSKRRRDLNLYIERTEHDDVFLKGQIKKVSISDFLEACRRANGVMVISQALKDYYIEKGCKPERVHVINMLADSTRFEGLEKQPVEPYIAYCGTASNNKDGVNQLITSFNLVSQRHPGVKLYIIGKTPSSKQRFDNYELVKKLGIEDKVVFTGVISSKEMPQMLKNACVLALDRPNNKQAKYGFPTKLGEYLLTENPVVVTKVGDIPLFLSDGVNALLASPDSPDEFASKLCWAIEHPKEASLIGEKGKQVAEENFNFMIETKKILKVLNQ